MKQWTYIFLMITLVSGCRRAPAPDPGPTQTRVVANIISKCALFIFSPDWIGYDESLTNTFSPAELSILKDNRENLHAMIELALQGRADSVGGAQLAAELKMSDLMPLLREHFFTPRHCYGWEGPDYSLLESYLLDQQYQYTMAYLLAIEELSGKPIHEAVIATKEELAILDGCLTNENREFFHWALWTQQKLKVKKLEN